MELINDYETVTDELSDKGYRLKTEAYLRRGFDIFRARPDLFILYTILYLALIPMGGFIISGPLIAGYFLVARAVEKKRPVHLENFFDGFQFFLTLFLVTVVTYVIVLAGLIFFIIPGIYLAVAYSFSIFFVIFGKMDFWDAMESSRKLIGREWFGFFGFILVLLFVNLLGVLAFGIGILFTMPVTACALYAAFDDIVGING